MDEELRRLQRLAYQDPDDGARVWQYLRQLERLAGISEPEPIEESPSVPGLYRVSFEISFPGVIEVRAESEEDAIHLVENPNESQLSYDYDNGQPSVVADWAELIRPLNDGEDIGNEDEDDDFSPEE